MNAPRTIDPNAADSILTPADYAAIRAAQDAEIARLRSISTSNTGAGFVAAFVRFYPRFLAFLVGVGETVLTLAQTIIVSFGVPLVLVLLMVVEQQRVTHGIALFETDPALAGIAASALVILNLVLEFAVHFIEHRAGYRATPVNRFSLRIAARGIAYLLGIGGKRWQAVALSPAHRYKRLLRIVTASILALALAGSMRSVIASQPGAWHVAIVAILRDSSLSLITTWVSGLLFATAAVLSAQGLSGYVAIRCAEIVAAMTAANASAADAEQAALAAIEQQYIAAKVASAATVVDRPPLPENADPAPIPVTPVPTVAITVTEAEPAHFLAVPRPLVTSNGHGAPEKTN